MGRELIGAARPLLDDEEIIASLIASPRGSR
jgi:hypothetical protein